MFYIYSLRGQFSNQGKFLQDVSFLEDNIILEEQFSNTNLHPSFPAATQEKPEYVEGLLEFKNTQKNNNKALAKVLHTDDNVVIKSSIESGEPALITEDVRKDTFSY